MYHLLILLVTFCSAANVLIINPTLGQSHINFLGNIADLLHRNGHNVTVISFEVDSSLKPFGTVEDVTKINFKSPYLQSSGYEKISAATGSIWNDDGAADTFADFEAYEEICSKYRKITKGFLENEQLFESLRASNFDVGITESLDLSGIGMLEHVRVRRIALASCIGPTDYLNEINGIPHFKSFTPSWMTAYTEHMTFYQRLVNTKLLLQFYYYYPLAERKLQEVFAEKYPDFPNLKKLLLNKVGVIFSNVNEFTETPRLRTNMIEYVGGSNYYKKNLTEKSNKILSLRSKTVLFSLGSFTKSCNMPLHVKRAIAESFASFKDVTFIWKYENCSDDDFGKSLYENVIFEEWVPQTELLNDDRLSLFITHGGQNSMLEAFYSGTPMLVIPIFADQMQNGANAVRRGMALLMDRTKISQEAMKQRIGELLNNGKYHTTAKNLKRILADKPNHYRKVILNWVDRLATLDAETDNLSLASRDMSVFVLYSLDILLFLICVLGTGLFVIYFLLKKLVCSLSESNHKPKKE